MSSQLEEVLKHRYIYMPRGTQTDTIQAGKRLGLAVAGANRAQLTIVAARKDSASHVPEFAKLDIVTERSGFPQDDGVVLAWCPTYKVMEKVQHLEHSVVVLVEWLSGEFDAWAQLVGAYNVVIGQVMNAGLSAETSEALEGIVREGYNGWTKTTDELLTLSYLRDLEAAGTYNRELVLAYARQSKSEETITRLIKLLTRFEAAQKQPPATSGSDFPTSRRW